nr:tiggrin-like isoform X2 [Pogona vitticeps]
MKMDGGMKIKKPQAIKDQQEELCVSRFHGCHLAKHQDCLRNTMAHHGMLHHDSALTSASVSCHRLSHAASGHCLEHELFSYPKEQLHMLELRAALTEQEKHFERLQMKINHLQDDLKNSELRATLQVEELKDYHGSWMCEIDVDHVGSQMNRTGKKSYVYIWQKSSNDKKTEDDTENIQKEHESLEKQSPKVVPQNNLSKGWLEASIEMLKKRDSKSAEENVLGWLQESMDRLKQKGSEASTQSLEEWLTKSFNNLEKECSETSRQDVKEWLEVSISYLKEEGPDTSHMNIEEWLEASMKSIQDLQQQNYEASKMNMEANCEEVVPVPLCSKQCIKTGWLQESLENLKTRGSKSSRENVHQWLQESLKSLKEQASEVPQKSLQEWLSESIRNLQDTGLETFRQDVKIWLETSIKNFQEEGPETYCLSVQEWLEESLKSLQEVSKQDVQGLPRPSMETPLQNGSVASIKGLKKGSTGASHITVQDQSIMENHEKSRLNVANWLQESLKSLIDEGPLASRQNVQEWLEESLKSVDDEYPEASRKDLREWLEASIKSFQEGGPEVPGQNLQDFLKASIMDIIEEEPESCDHSVKEWLEKSIKSVNEAASRIKVQKWLEGSMKTLEEAGADISQQNLEQWLETSMQNLNGRCSETSKHEVKEWLEASLRNLQQQGLDASKVNLKEWLEASVTSLRKQGPKESITDVQEWLEESIQSLKQEACRLNVEEWLSESLEYLQKEDPEALKEDVKEWLEDSLANLHEICPEASRQAVKRWLKTSMKGLHEVPKEDLQNFLMTSMSDLRLKSLAASRKNNMDWLKVPECLVESRDTLEKIKHNLARRKVYSAQHDAFGPKKTQTNFEREEPAVPQLIIFQPKQALTRLWNIILWYRTHPLKFFNHLLCILIPFMLLVAVYKYYQQCCITCLFQRGLRPH